MEAFTDGVLVRSRVKGGEGGGGVEAKQNTAFHRR